MLKVTDLSVSYGAIQALGGVSFEIPAGDIVTLIGGNGAGKTTALRTISGLLRPLGGTIHFRGEEITRLQPHDIVARGLCHVPEGRMIFANLTVDENLAMGAYLQTDKTKIAGIREYVFGIFPRLKERLKQVAGTLSGGEQQMLAIARGLVSHPRILLLDEPSLGLAPSMIAELYELLADLRDDGATILIVDQMANLTLAIADRGYVLGNGIIVHAGSAQELRTDSAVERAYLGQDGP